MTPSPLRLAGRGLAAALALAVVFLLVVLVAPGVIGAEGAYVVRSDSMAPAIQAGDIVVVSGVAPAAIDPGDIITYRSEANSPGDGTALVTHRVVALEERDGRLRFRTRGDANEEPDPALVAPEQVVGVVWFRLPLVGWAVAFAGSDIGIVALVVLPSAALAVTELYELYSAWTADER